MIPDMDKDVLVRLISFGSMFVTALILYFVFGHKSSNTPAVIGLTSKPIVPPVDPKQSRTSKAIPPITNPKLVSLMPVVEGTVKEIGRPVHVNHVATELRKKYGDFYTRRDCKAVLTALVGDRQTLRSTVKMRGRHRRRVLYAAA